MDRFGDHTLSCAAAGRYQRHNRLRNCLFRLGEEAGWSPQLEVQAPGTHSRPTDVLFHSPGHKPLSVGVTVVHPLRPSNRNATGNDSADTANCAELAK